jgi:NADH-quinone oxidoreductase subunit M
MLLSGIMLKMGIYGVIRWMIPIVPYALMDQWGGYLAIILSVIGIVYASVIAIMQSDYKRLIAYASLAHVGLIAAGVLTMTYEGLQGSVIRMLAHGVDVVGLFFIVEIIFERTKTRNLAELGGIRTVAPQLTTLFVIILFSSIALPLTGGFVGEFLLFVGIFKYAPIGTATGWIAPIAGLTIILGAVYMLKSFQKAMLGETTDKTMGFEDLRLNEKAVLIPIVIVIFLIGIYPKLFLEISEPAVNNIIQEIRNTYTLR